MVFISPPHIFIHCEWFSFFFCSFASVFIDQLLCVSNELSTVCTEFVALHIFECVCIGACSFLDSAFDPFRGEFRREMFCCIRKNVILFPYDLIRTILDFFCTSIIISSACFICSTQILCDFCSNLLQHFCRVIFVLVEFDRQMLIAVRAHVIAVQYGVWWIFCLGVCCCVQRTIQFG